MTHLIAVVYLIEIQALEKEDNFNTFTSAAQ